MELTGRLKEKISKADDKKEVSEIMKDAGFILTDEELDQLCGGYANDTVMFGSILKG